MTGAVTQTIFRFLGGGRGSTPAVAHTRKTLYGADTRRKTLYGADTTRRTIYGV